MPLFACFGGDVSEPEKAKKDKKDKDKEETKGKNKENKKDDKKDKQKEKDNKKDKKEDKKDKKKTKDEEENKPLVQEKAKEEQKPLVKETGEERFQAPYEWKQNNTIILRHCAGQSIRAGENDTHGTDGTNGPWAQWETTLEDGITTLKNVKTGKYLQIDENKVNVEGTDASDDKAKFKFHKFHSNIVLLESVAHEGTYLAVRGGELTTGVGHTFCRFMGLKKSTISNPWLHGYIFKQENQVILEHRGGHMIRINPENQKEVDHEGLKGKFAHWWAIPNGDTQEEVQFKSMVTCKYLRIIEDGNKIDANGVGGPYTKFKVHWVNEDKTNMHNTLYKLESMEYPGKFISVDKDTYQLQVGDNNMSAVIAVYKQGDFNDVTAPGKTPAPTPPPEPAKDENGVQEDLPDNPEDGQFQTYYEFKHSKRILLRLVKGNHLRVNPENTQELDIHGGPGQFAQWDCHVVEASDETPLVRFKNIKSQTYLRIMEDGDINVQGGTGPLSVFKVHYIGGSHVKLESNQYPGKYIAVRDAKLITGTGGPYCRITAIKRANEAQPYLEYYRFGAANRVIMHQTNKDHLRVNPEDDTLLTNGKKGQFAQWWAVPELDGDDTIITFQSQNTKKYLTFAEDGNKIDVSSEEINEQTKFKVHKDEEHNGAATLESVACPGKYLAIKEDQVFAGEGGSFCFLVFYRETTQDQVQPPQ